MNISELPFGTNIRIPEKQENGSYKLANYTYGCLNNFGVGTAGLIRKDIHSKCRFGNDTDYVNSELDERMNEIYGSFPAELRFIIIPATLNLMTYKDKNEKISRFVFAPTLSMIDNGYDNEGLAWPIFNTYDNCIKKYNGSAARWWLASRYYSSGVWGVDADGSSYSSYPSYSYGVAPAFIIPQSTQIEDSPNPDGSYGLKMLQGYYFGCN